MKKDMTMGHVENRKPQPVTPERDCGAPTPEAPDDAAQAVEGVVTRWLRETDAGRTVLASMPLDRAVDGIFGLLAKGCVTIGIADGRMILTKIQPVEGDENEHGP